jgi:histidine ammonia-lyase
MQGRSPAGGLLRAAYDLAAATLDPTVEDRPLDTDITTAGTLLTHASFSQDQ